jgi:hypothetical protein
VSATLRPEEFDAVYDRWQALMPESSVDNAFVAPHIQRIWWRRFGSGFDLHMLSASDGPDTFGFAPLMSGEGTLSFIGGDDLFDYHDFPVRRGSEQQFFGLLCDYLADLDWDTVELSSVPSCSPTLAFLPEAAKARGMNVELTSGQVTPVAVLPASWEQYVSGLSKKARHELRRKLRRLENADGSRQYVCGDDEIAGSMEQFFRLMRSSSPDKDAFLGSERIGFFQDLAVELSARDEFRLYLLDYEGAPVAACICIDYGDSYFLYNSGYDPEFSALSVGLLNKALSIRDAIEQGKKSFNFLKGNERYKYDLGGLDRGVRNVRLTR